jgi:23S rRNA (adenine-N6)-dimethyltransferase
VSVLWSGRRLTSWTVLPAPQALAWKRLATATQRDRGQRRESSSRAPSPERTERDLRRRTYGQNFLRSRDLARELVAAAEVSPSDLIIEPGAGTGVITEQLARAAARVIAIELDPAWVVQLREKLAPFDNVEVVQGDFFDFKLPRRASYRVFGNIPFGVTTRLLRHLLDESANPPKRSDVIVQIEVARKHAAQRPANALTASWQPWFGFQVTRTIPPEAFRPVPKVGGALLSIRRRGDPPLSPTERQRFASFVSAGFSGPNLWVGLRRLLTANQARQLRRHNDLTGDVKASQLTTATWIELFVSAQRFSSR